MKKLTLLLAAVFLVTILPQRAEAGFRNSRFGTKMLCGDHGQTFPVLYRGKKPMTMCMIWSNMGNKGGNKFGGDF